jgi:PadR family transcriptional regulator PadR
MPRTPESLQGTLELLVLKTLESSPNHGFGIAQHVKEASAGLLSVEEGSLYPALHRMEKAGLLKAEWRITGNGRRARVYALTASGRKRLSEAQRGWANLSKGVGRLLRFA